MEISTTKFVTSTNDGNPNPQNLKDFPIIEIDGARSVQVRERVREGVWEEVMEGGRGGSVGGSEGRREGRV